MHVISAVLLLALAIVLPTCSRAQGIRNTSVFQFHKNPSKDGYYIDSVLQGLQPSRTRVARGFVSPFLTGQSYAQLLYVDRGSLGRDILVSATQSNHVAAFFAGNGTLLWQRKLADAVPSDALPCGNISPVVGVLSTPIIDDATNIIVLSAKSTADGGITQKYQFFGLEVASGRPVPGYPIDVAKALASIGIVFETPAQLQRASLLFQDGIAYAGYGGNYGDCQQYRGRVVGLRVADARIVYNFNTSGNKGAVWAPGGPAGDGSNVFVGTGNTEGTAVYAEGNSVLRLSPDLKLGEGDGAFFAPKDWQRLDTEDLDLGTAGPVTFDLPGSTPNELLFIGGKEGVVYLLNRNVLGGFDGAIASATVSDSVIITAPAVYNSSGSTYVAIRGAGSDCPRGGSGDLIGLRIIQGAPPTIRTAWCANATAIGNSPIATTPEADGKATVWIIGGVAQTELYSLNAYDGETGELLYQSPAIKEAVSRFHSPIQAKGRIYFSSDTNLLAYSIGSGTGSSTPSADSPATRSGVAAAPGPTPGSSSASSAITGNHPLRCFCQAAAALTTAVLCTLLA